MQTLRILFCVIFLLVLHGAFDWYANQARDVGIDVPSGKLNSLSFAPFREGVSPLKEEEPLLEHIDEDLKLLADKTHSIRTYSSLGGLQPTPDLARKHGLTMIQGAWLGDADLKNQKEIKALVESANANPDVVKRVIVGNEVLLRGELSVDRLIEYIREVKRQVKQPVSYADVWSMYMKHPQLIKEVDFITIHILPYWEDEPISVEHAGEHLEKIVRQVENEARGIAPGKPILIGESGWPSAGRQRGMAVPGVANEAKFIRDMIQVGKQHDFDYNIVEAFNQPWKSNLEGVVGANWGLLSADRKPVFPLTGKVYENPDWMLHFAATTILWLLVVVRYFKALQRLSLPRAIVLLALAQLFSACLVELGDFLWYTSYSDFQRGYTVVMVAANALLAAMLLERNLDILATAADNEVTAGRLRKLYLFFIALAFFKTLGLAVNGRYLSFPVEQFAIPAFGIIGLIACRWFSDGRISLSSFGFDRLSGWSLHGRHDRTMANLLIFAMLGLVIGETRAFLLGRDFILAHPALVEGLPVALGYTLKNLQLVTWLACLLVLSIPFWRNNDGKLSR